MGRTNSNNTAELEEMAEFFNARAAGYEDHMAETVSSFEGFYAKISEPIAETDERIQILDLGSGTGLELKGFLKKAPHAQITCIDVSERMLEILRTKYRRYSKQITVIRDSFKEIPFGYDKYDYAVSVMSLHHYLHDEKRDIYKKVKTSLRNEGKYIEGDYIVSEEEEQRFLREYDKKIKDLMVPPEKVYHIDVPFSVKTQIGLMMEAGFSDVETIFHTDRAAVFVASSYDK
jgi:tRNA (cmo5U34)-methyltransferase